MYTHKNKAYTKYLHESFKLIDANYSTITAYVKTLCSSFEGCM